MATVTHEVWQDQPVVVLTNRSFSVSLIPAIGSNAYRMRDRIADREILRVPDSVEALRSAPGHYGIPLLLPPSRIRGASFPFNGKTYKFEPSGPDGHLMHGFVRSRPWKVVQESASAESDSASVTTEFAFADFPELLAQYPHDLRIRAVTEISGDSLIQTFTFHNASDEPAPLGFGLHTWFMLDGEPEAWTLTAPVEDVWEFDGPLPTGRRLPLGKYEALNSGMNLKGHNMDNAFRIGRNPKMAVLSRPGYTIRYSGNEPFTQWVIYTKGEVRDTICLEPLTWTTDAPNLPDPPEYTGVRAVGPGETLELVVRMDIERG